MAKKPKKKEVKRRIPLPEKPPKVIPDQRKERQKKICREKVEPPEEE
jgi:hypothetical protein